VDAHKVRTELQKALISERNNSQVIYKQLESIKRKQTDEMQVDEPSHDSR